LISSVKAGYLVHYVISVATAFFHHVDSIPHWEMPSSFF
jgi:hypothetical protein